MGGFSRNQDVDGFCQICGEGNAFVAYCPGNSPPLTGIVNGTPLQIPLMGPPVANSLSHDQTRGALELQVGSRRHTIVSDLGVFNRSRAEEVGIAVGMFEQAQGASPAQVQPNSSSIGASEDVYNVAPDAAIAAMAPSQGVVDLDTADEYTLRWMAISIASTLGMIDNASGLQALSNATGGGVDFTLTGTNTVPLMVELTDLLRRGENRAFLRDVFKSGTKARIWTNSAGNVMVSFRGYAGLRSFLNAPSYLATNARVSVISTAIKNSGNWAGTLRSVGGRIPVISYVIVGSIDVAQWLAQPAAERDFTDLMATLFVDISVLAIATIAGAFGAAVAISLTAPVWLVVAAGLGAAVGIGIALDIVNSQFQITQFIKDRLNALQSSMAVFASEVGDAIDAVSEFATNATPGDGRISGPTDYLMEIHTGIINYIYSRLRFRW